MRIEDLYVEVRDKNLKRRGQITSQHINLKAKVVHCGVGTWSLMLPREHPMVNTLWQPGAGIFISLRGKPFLSGPVTQPGLKASPEDPAGTLTFAGVDDNILLYDGRAWPNPSESNPALQINDSDVRQGAVETLMHSFVNANIGPGAPLARRGLLAQKLVMGPNLGRGPQAVKTVRFDRLGDVLTDLALYGGMGFRVIQRNEQLVFETYMIRDRTKFIRFSIENGSLSDEEIQVSPPELTRALVGGQGKGGNRIIVQRTTPESLAAEAAWGRKIENWIDKRNTEDPAELTQEGDAALLDNGFTSTAVKAVPNDDTSMVYMDEWLEGDKVTVLVQEQETIATVTQVAMVANKDGAAIGAAIGDVSGFATDSALGGRVDDTARRLEALERTAEESMRPKDPVTRFYSANATWTKPEGLAFIRLVLVGGGGGGGGRIQATGTASCGGGGGSGGYAELTIPASALPSSASVVVGAAGVGVSGAAGTAGGESSFATYRTLGGQGGQTGTAATSTTTAWNGGAGGTTAGFNNTFGLFINGQGGARGQWIGGETMMTNAGAGGSNPLGAGGMAPPAGSTGVSYAASGFGAGGSGIAGLGSPNFAGASGSPGRVIVTEYYN